MGGTVVGNLRNIPKRKMLPFLLFFLPLKLSDGSTLLRAEVRFTEHLEDARCTHKWLVDDGPVYY